jgi:hypothetical protein
MGKKRLALYLDKYGNPHTKSIFYFEYVCLSLEVEEEEEENPRNLQEDIASVIY